MARTQKRFTLRILRASFTLAKESTRVSARVPVILKLLPCLKTQSPPTLPISCPRVITF
ncbi:hypothetical protein ACRALDRAFT_2037666 [Sodiomyces alcalophilus JCM 7366]|uniref:uncharacterized protein n=1 Tax=Sodiomyces alcalophilus JCM 7366 TaxID=591952 RepID=UPI0039B56611